MSNVISNKGNMRQYFCQCSISLLLVNDLRLIPPLQRKKPSDAPTQFLFHCFSVLFVKDLKLNFSPPPNRKKLPTPLDSNEALNYRIFTQCLGCWLKEERQISILLCSTITNKSNDLARNFLVKAILKIY